MDQVGKNIEAFDTQVSLSPTRKNINWSLVLLYFTLAIVGSIGAPLLQRLYYIQGGNRIWFSSWLESAGFPFLIAPLSFLYLRKSTNTIKSVFFMETNLFISSFIIGVICGFDNYMYSLGLSFVPVSTSCLLLSTQLSFTALFAFLFVKQRFTFYSINTIVLMSLGAVVLALHASGDQPPDVTKETYLFGFFITLASAVLMGLISPLVELAYSKSERSITCMMVIQFQIVMSLAETIVSTIGMLIYKDFEIIPQEARDHGLGKVKYYLVMVAGAIMWQVASLGLLGVVHCSSSFATGIIIAILVPLTQISAVIIFHEEFSVEKGMSLALCLWGFTSYLFGEYKKTSKS